VSTRSLYCEELAIEVIVLNIETLNGQKEAKPEMCKKLLRFKKA